MHCNVPPGFGPTANGESTRIVSPGSILRLATRYLDKNKIDTLLRIIKSYNEIIMCVKYYQQ